VPLPLETQNLLAGAQGLSVAYHCATVKAPTGSVEAWVEAGPLPVAPSGADHPEPLTQSEWAAWVLGWSQQSQQGVGLWPQDVLEDHPDAAPFFPGVVLDASLPEAFRVHFAEWMPGVDAWDPCVLAAVTNAPDKDAPLVLAMLNVLRRSGGPSPEERAARRAVNQTLYVMSQDAQNPLLFRLHAAHMFRVGTPYQDFMVRTEPHFKLLAADELRGVGGRDFPTVPRTEVRAGLTALVSDATPFVAGPLAGKYPANATVGQVASIILADLEAMWAAEPYEER
jgi:hypothetical protein